MTPQLERTIIIAVTARVRAHATRRAKSIKEGMGGARASIDRTGAVIDCIARRDRVINDLWQRD